MTNDDFQIRPAQPDDAPVAAVLLVSAYQHHQLNYPLPEEHGYRFIEHLELFFRQDDNRFSYRNTFVAHHGPEVIGLILSFGGRDEERLNTAIGRHREHEAHDDEWYVDAVAVLADWGRRGIGTRLMQTAEQQACDHYYTKVALNVAQGNEQAQSLYRRLHYVITGETTLYQQAYLRAVKTLTCA